MNNTVRERILDNMAVAFAAVPGVTGADRWDRSDTAQSDYPWIEIAANAQESVRSQSRVHQSFLTWDMEVLIRQYFQHDKVVFTGATDKLVGSIIGDLVKAGLSDIQWGTEAISTDIVSVGPQFEADEDAYVQLELTVRYRHSRTDPTVTV